MKIEITRQEIRRVFALCGHEVQFGGGALELKLGVKFPEGLHFANVNTIKVSKLKKNGEVHRLRFKFAHNGSSVSFKADNEYADIDIKRLKVFLDVNIIKASYMRSSLRQNLLREIFSDLLKEKREEVAKFVKDAKLQDASLKYNRKLENIIFVQGAKTNRYSGEITQIIYNVSEKHDEYPDLNAKEATDQFKFQYEIGNFVLDSFEELKAIIHFLGFSNRSEFLKIKKENNHRTNAKHLKGWIESEIKQDVMSILGGE